MDLVVLKKQIKDKQLNNFYVLAGEEIGVLNMYIEKMGSNVIRADEVSDIWRQLTSRSLGGEKPVYVIRDDKKFMSMETVWSGLQSKIKNGILVLCVTNLDKRSKFYKEFKDDICVFERLTPEQLLRVCKGQLPTSDENLRYLIKLCCNDYTRIMNEIDKLKRVGSKVTKELMDELIQYKEEVTVFTYIDHILRGEYTKSIASLDCLLSDKQSGVGILTLLYMNFRDAVLVIGNSDGKHGVNNYIAKQIKDKLVYKPEELLKILRIIQKYEQGIKTGLYEESFAVQCATVEILSV